MIVIPPCPDITEPERRQQMQWRCIWTAICRSDANEDILWIDFGVLYGDIEVTIRCKHTGIDQFVFGFTSSATAVLCHQFSVGEGTLRIFVQCLHIGMRRGAVKKVVVLLHILTVVAFRAGQAEEALLEDRISSIPQAEGETHSALFIADAQQTIFTP